MSDEPKTVDVVIPYHSHHALAIRAARSALAIKGVQRVFLVSDGAEVGQDFEVVVHLENLHPKGAPGARLTGIHASKSEFIVFCDQDDVLLPLGIDELIEEVVASRSNFGFGRIFSKDKLVSFPSVKKDAYHEVLRELSLVPFSGLIVRRRDALKAGMNTALPSWQDDDFCIRLSKIGKVARIDSPVARMESTPDSISSNYARLHSGLEMLLEDNKEEILRHHGLFFLNLWKLRLCRLGVLARLQPLLLQSLPRRLAGSSFRVIVFLTATPFTLLFRRVHN